MNLADLANRFTQVRWNASRDAFLTPCPRHPGSMAIATVAGLKCHEGCTSDQILAANALQNGRRENPPSLPNYVNGAPPAPASAPVPRLGREQVIAHWQGKLIEVARNLTSEVKTVDDLAEMLMVEVLKEAAPKYVQRPADLKDLDDNELEGIFAFVAQTAWAERQFAPQIEGTTDEQALVIWEDHATAVAANAEYLKRVPVIERLAYSESTSLLVGPKHGGKTSNVRTVAMSVMRGLPIWDRQTTKGHVIYVASDDEVAATRMTLLKMGWNEGVDPLVLARQSPEAVMAAPGAVLDQIAKRALKLGTILIILDMLFDFAAIKDEMSYAGTRMAVGSLQHLADVTKAHVMATHHSPKYMLDTATAATAALGSQGIAARFSPIILSRKWADTLFTIESTMTRDPRGLEMPQTCIELDELGWAKTAGQFKSWMKWKMYARRIMGHIEAGEPGTEFSVAGVAKELEIPRPEVQNALFQLFKAEELDRVKRNRSFKYFVKNNELQFGNAENGRDLQGNYGKD